MSTDKVNSWLPRGGGAAEMGSDCSQAQGFFGDETFWNRWWLHSPVNVLKTTELYTLGGELHSTWTISQQSWHSYKMQRADRSPEWRNQPSRPNFIFSPPPVDSSGVCFILALLRFTCTPEGWFEKIIFWKNNWISNLAHHWWLPHGARLHFISPLFYCVFPVFKSEKLHLFFPYKFYFVCLKLWTLYEYFCKKNTSFQKKFNPS